jgi:nucleotide-binding universal stress UspA family protein
MHEIKTVLFPVDFSESSKKIINYVKLFAKNCNANIMLLHVIRGPEDFTGFELGTAWWSNFEKDLRDGAQKAMERFIDENFSEVTLIISKAEIVIGDPVEELLKFSKENFVDLIIMGTHGRKGLEKAMFGSVAEGIISRSECPVLTVNPFLKSH